MDTEIDLTTASRDVLIAIIVQQQAVIAELQVMIVRLERRVAELEGQAKPGGPPRMPGLKSSSGRQPPAQQQPRKQRRHGFARRRMTPTHRVEHMPVENCPDCGAHRSDGWVQRTREVIELPVVPVPVTEHVFIARTCPACRRRCTPPAQLDGVVLGRQRLGVNLLSRIATLREEGRLPPGVELPEWCAPMTLHQYQNRAFEQPRSVLEGLIHPDKYTRARRPGIGDWTIVGDQVIIGIEPLGARRIRDEIPNWILNRPASISGQIVLKKEPLDSFLGQTTRSPRRFRWF